MCGEESVVDDDEDVKIENNMFRAHGHMTMHAHNVPSTMSSVHGGGSPPPGP